MPFLKTTASPTTELHYVDIGEGQPVVLIHAWPVSHRMWESQITALAEAGYRCIAYDRRGFGESGRPTGGYDYDTFVSDLNDLMTQLDVSDAVLAGFSMGGGEVARYLTRHRASKVRQAVLIASIVPYLLRTPDNPAGVEQKVFDGMADGIAADRAAFWPLFFKSFYGVGRLSHPVSQEVIDWSCDLSMQASLRATLECAKSFSTTDLRPDLKSFTVPTLIIHGTADQTVPIDTSARAAAAGIAGSTLLEYDGAPHGLLASHKPQLIADVLQFLARGA